jgi:hypothetical protein
MQDRPAQLTMTAATQTQFLFAGRSLGSGRADASGSASGDFIAAAVTQPYPHESIFFFCAGGHRPWATKRPRFQVKLGGSTGFRANRRNHQMRELFLPTKEPRVMRPQRKRKRSNARQNPKGSSQDIPLFRFEGTPVAALAGLANPISADPEHEDEDWLLRNRFGSASARACDVRCYRPSARLAARASLLPQRPSKKFTQRKTTRKVVKAANPSNHRNHGYGRCG